MQESQLGYYSNIIPIGTEVQIIRPIHTTEDGWIAVPMSFQASMVPDGYILMNSWRKVTGYDCNNQEPVIVQEHINCSIRHDDWFGVEDEIEERRRRDGARS